VRWEDENVRNPSRRMVGCRLKLAAPAARAPTALRPHSHQPGQPSPRPPSCQRSPACRGWRRRATARHARIGALCVVVPTPRRGELESHGRSQDGQQLGDQSLTVPVAPAKKVSTRGRSGEGLGVEPVAHVHRIAMRSFGPSPGSTRENAMSTASRIRRHSAPGSARGRSRRCARRRRTARDALELLPSLLSHQQLERRTEQFGDVVAEEPASARWRRDQPVGR